jgi:alkylhydroperoxidase family enzyme
MSPRISWIEEGDARGQLADLFEASRSGSVTGMRREHVPDILHAMSHRPDFLAAIMDASRLHFSDGALTRAQHEMIASYVSALNHCHY